MHFLQDYALCNFSTGRAVEERFRYLQDSQTWDVLDGPMCQWHRCQGCRLQATGWPIACTTVRPKMARPAAAWCGLVSGRCLVCVLGNIPSMVHGHLTGWSLWLVTVSHMAILAARCSLSLPLFAFLCLPPFPSAFLSLHATHASASLGICANSTLAPIFFLSLHRSGGSVNRHASERMCERLLGVAQTFPRGS